MIDREQLVGDLAKVHGIRLDAEDPVLVAALLNQRLLDEAIARLELAVRVSADRVTAAAAVFLTAPHSATHRVTHP